MKTRSAAEIVDAIIGTIEAHRRLLTAWRVGLDVHEKAEIRRDWIAIVDDARPEQNTAVTNILDMAHAALRGIECEVIPMELDRAVIDRPELDRAVDARAAIEEFARGRGITLSEFRK
jgi:hypothetical protein